LAAGVVSLAFAGTSTFSSAKPCVGNAGTRSARIFERMGQLCSLLGNISRSTTTWVADTTHQTHPTRAPAGRVRCGPDPRRCATGCTTGAATYASGLVAKGAIARSPFRHARGQRGDMPWPDVDGPVRKQEQKGACQSRDTAGYHHRQGSRPRELHLVVTVGCVLPPISEEHSEDDEWRREVEPDPQPKSDIAMDEPVPMQDGCYPHQARECRDGWKATRYRVPLRRSDGSEEEICATEVYRAENHG
jgi:hypothetical protein